MDNYNKLIQQVLTEGQTVRSRAGDVLRISHAMLSYDLRKGFPAITGRKLAFKTMAAELACFVKGHTDIREFHARNCHIWDANLAEYNKTQNTPNNTDLGPIYGRQWRNFNGEDQLLNLINEAKQNPQSRRLLVTAWNPPFVPLMALPPCHLMFQVSIVGLHLDLCFYMRSVDLALGFPFDIASYALLQHLLAAELNLKPRQLTCFMADAHIYYQNLSGLTEYLARPTFNLPQLALDLTPNAFVEDFEPEQATLVNYQHGPAIPMTMAV